MVVVDRICGRPVYGYHKGRKQGILRMVKFFKDYPYLFPVFNEKNLNGDIIYMNDGEIWYRDKM